jgi:hypothetical protein
LKQGTRTATRRDDGVIAKMPVPQSLPTQLPIA